MTRLITGLEMHCYAPELNTLHLRNRQTLPAPTTTAHTQGQQPTAPAHPDFAQWGLPHTVTPRFGARLIQEHHRLHFLSDRASLIGEWEEETIDQLEVDFPTIVKEFEAKLLKGELDAQHQKRITIQHRRFTCEADTLGSHGYVYVAIYPATSMDANLDRKT